MWRKATRLNEEKNATTFNYHIIKQSNDLISTMCGDSLCGHQGKFEYENTFLFQFYLDLSLIIHDFQLISNKQSN